MFLEVRFPEDISFFKRGGPSFNTTIVQLNSGFEQRNQNWQEARCKYRINQGLRTGPNGPQFLRFENALNLFRACKGSLHSFRFKDPDDFKASTASGILDLGLGSGKPVYQLTKKYAVGQLVDYREIKKPVSNTLAVFKNSILQTQGTAPGNYSIDYTTGLVTFVASSQFSIISITVSPTNPIVTTSVAHNFTVGQKIYLSNLNPSTSLNLNAFTVTAVTSNTFTISVNNTVNVTAGTASLFPQPTDFLTASFEFDVPVRFDTDDMDTGIGDGGFIEWDSISLVEVRI